MYYDNEDIDKEAEVKKRKENMMDWSDESILDLNNQNVEDEERNTIEQKKDKWESPPIPFPHVYSVVDEFGKEIGKDSNYQDALGIAKYYGRNRKVYVIGVCVMVEPSEPKVTHIASKRVE